MRGMLTLTDEELGAFDIKMGPVNILDASLFPLHLNNSNKKY